MEMKAICITDLTGDRLFLGIGFQQKLTVTREFSSYRSLVFSGDRLREDTFKFLEPHELKKFKPLLDKAFLGYIR